MDNVVIGTMCALFFRRWGWLYFILAAAIAWSRMYLGAHWPSDVVGTAFLAAGEALLVLALAELAWKRWGPRVAPGIFARHQRLID
jgi:undecaprenyl-diphosphatase